MQPTKLVRIAIESFGNSARLSYVEGEKNVFFNLVWLASTQKRNEENEPSEETSFTCSREKLASAVQALRSPTRFFTHGKMSGHAIEFVCVSQLASNCESAHSHEYVTGSNDEQPEGVWVDHARSIAKHFDAIPA